MIENIKTIVIADNKRGPQGPTGGITDEAREALEEIRSGVIHVDQQTAAAETSAQTASAEAQTAAQYAASAAQSAQAAAVYAGLYDPVRTYHPPDMAVVNGQTYRCVQTSTGEYPPDSAKWVLVALVAYETFVLDHNEDLMPAFDPRPSEIWAIDESGDIAPRLGGM